MRHRYPENIKVLAAAAEYKVTVLEKNRGEYSDFELGAVLDLVLVLASQLTPQCIEKRPEKPRERSSRAQRVWSVVSEWTPGCQGRQSRGLASWRWERAYQSQVPGLLLPKAHGLGDTVPSTSGWFHFPPPPCPQAHLEPWILTNLFLPHLHQHL